MRGRRSHGRTRPGRLSEWDAAEAFFSPLPIVLQGFRSFATFMRAPSIVVDIGAGAGPFGQAARLLWPSAELVAIEIRGSEEPHLRRHYDRVLIADATKTRLPQADFLTGNTAFSLTCTLAEQALGAVRPGGHVAFLTRQTLGDAEVAEDLLTRFPPLLELSISGRVSMGSAGEVSADWFGYQWLVWGSCPRPRGSAWQRRLLPRLDNASLGWTARPGTGRLIDVDPDLVLDLRGEVPRG